MQQGEANHMRLLKMRANACMAGERMPSLCFAMLKFERLQGFDCAELLYSDYAQLPSDVEAKLGAKYSSLEDMVK